MQNAYLFVCTATLRTARQTLERGVMRHTDLSAGTLTESPCAETVGPKWVHSVE